MSDHQLLGFSAYTATQDDESPRSGGPIFRFNWVAAAAVGFCAAFWWIAAAIMQAAF